jgi:diguanylate cyclase (GGDEF)-like protein
MNPKSGKMFSIGHAIIPIIMFSLYLDSTSQPVMLAILFGSLVWTLYLIWIAFFSDIAAIVLKRSYYWFFILVDSAIITTVYTLPDWSHGTQPTWLVLFLVPLYAFELGMFPAIWISSIGIGNLYLYADYQRASFFSLDTFLIICGLIIFTFFFGKRTDNLRQLAYHDALTGLPNRELFKVRLNQLLMTQRPNKASLGIMFIDLDQFKYVNNTMGHAAGDKLLQAVAKRISQALPAGAVLARMGGDEFTVLLSDMMNSDEAAHASDKIKEALKASIPIKQQEIYVTASIGISVYPEDGSDIETLMKNADTAMYRAKEQGRDNYQYYTPTVHTQGIKRLQMETMLRHALERDEFVVYYQPRVDTHTNELVAVEALVRWNHPELGMIPPGEFIPLAEDTGLIVAIGEQVLRKACMQRRKWTDIGLPPFRVSVNLSARQFRQSELPEIIQRALKESGLSPTWLELEITESAAMQDVNYAIIMLKVLKEMDLWIAIDDFGTGYSSLNYLKRFPIDVIKIDRSFISGIQDNSDDAAIVKAIIVLAQSLKLHVTAEGVETSTQLEFLKEQNCTEIQGFLTGKPMSADTLEAWFNFEQALGAN